MSFVERSIILCPYLGGSTIYTFEHHCHREFMHCASCYHLLLPAILLFLTPTGVIFDYENIIVT